MERHLMQRQSIARSSSNNNSPVSCIQLRAAAGRRQAMLVAAVKGNISVQQV